MFSRPAVVIFGLAVAELFVLAQAASAFGFGAAIVALILASAAGVVLLKRGGVRFVQSSLNRVVDSGNQAAEVIADRGMLVLAALLLIVPGFITAIAGILLFVPSIRAAARPVVLHRVQPWIPTNLQFGRARRFAEGVVDVDIVDVDDPNSGPSRAPRSELS